MDDDRARLGGRCRERVDDPHRDVPTRQLTRHRETHRTRADDKDWVAHDLVPPDWWQQALPMGLHEGCDHLDQGVGEASGKRAELPHGSSANTHRGHPSRITVSSERRLQALQAVHGLVTDLVALNYSRPI